MLPIRFCQFIRVVLLGLTISLPTAARAEIIADSDAVDPASDSPVDESSAEPPSSDIASTDGSSTDSVTDSPTTSSSSDDPYFEVVGLLVDPLEAPSLLDDYGDESARYNFENLDAADFDPSTGDTSFSVSDDMSIPDSIVVPTPEPGSLAVWTMAVVGIAGYRRLRRQQPAVE
ncbi:MAG: hypothetical protein HZA46_11235 [Planctomycetales bacterium]|nr:hypothetical protein [Planctomycetales bacterium]